MIALDTNLLIHARREEMPRHRQAKEMLRDLAEGDDPWMLPWPCLYEFLRVVTHARVFDPPTPLEKALDDLESLLASPSIVLAGEGPGHFAHLRQMALVGQAVGNLAHDAHIAALAQEHGASEIWTRDRDFARFPGIRTRDPFAVSR